MILVNMKNYLGYREGVVFVKELDSLYREYGGYIGIAVPYPLLYLAEVMEIPLYAQHVDPVERGAYTGHLPPFLLKEMGVSGSLLNHSERRLRLDTIHDTVGLLRENGLESVVCARNPEEVRALSAFSPTYVAMEPPSLIGSGKSVSTERPEEIKEASRYTENLLVGAGIRSREDVETAIRLGAKGVLVASAAVRGGKEKVRELIEGLLEV